MTTDQHTELAPVRVTVSVKGTPERAFRVFTEDMGKWWPIATHSIEPDQTVTAEMEPRLGGRILERHRDGTEARWGEIIEWDPPYRLVFSWNPTYQDRPDTEVEVTFSEHDDGTRVVLEHRGWERLGAAGVALRGGYTSGWRTILDHRFVPALAGPETQGL